MFKWVTGSNALRGSFCESRVFGLVRARVVWLDSSEYWLDLYLNSTV